MAATGKSALANLLSNIVGPMIGVVMTPFYLQVIGLEGLGLVGLMTVLTSVLGLFISGISKAYQRDLSTANATSPEDLSGLLRGGIILFASAGVLLGLLVLLFGRNQFHEIARDSHFTIATLDRCLIVIAAMIGLGILSGAISTSLVALKDQIFLAKISAITSVFGALFSWHVLSRWPRVDVFYFCQLVVASIAFVALVGRILLIQSRNARQVPQRSMRQVWQGKLRKEGMFAGILILHEGMGMMITQIDRILITALFPLSALGAYNLGANPARMTSLVTAPVNVATFPEICAIAATGNSREVIGEYIARVTFLMWLIFSAVILVLASSGQDLLNLWLGAGKVPAQTAIVLTLLSAGHLLLAIAGPYYNLTVAYGRIGYGIPKNIISLLILPPLGYFAAKTWGLPGAAAVWFTYGISCVAVCSWIVFRRHADFRSGLRWHVASLSCVSVGLLAAALLSLIPPIHGWLRILIAGLVTGIFITGYLVLYFGWSIQSWFGSIDLKRPPSESPST